MSEHSRFALSDHETVRADCEPTRFSLERGARTLYRASSHADEASRFINPGCRHAKMATIQRAGCRIVDRHGSRCFHKERLVFRPDVAWVIENCGRRGRHRRAVALRATSTMPASSLSHALTSAQGPNCAFEYAVSSQPRHLVTRPFLIVK